MISDEEMINLIKDAAEEDQFDRMSLEQMEKIYNQGSILIDKGLSDDGLLKALNKFKDAIEKRKTGNTAPYRSKTSPVKDEIYPFSFQGNGGTLFGIQIINLLLIIVTLGIYFFWAKARVRKYLWNQVDFNGDRFEYHGTGIEVLKGWLKALLVFGIPFWTCKNLPAIIGAPRLFIVIGAIISFVVIGIFIPVATVGSRRYRLSRTSLRGIRFSFRGKWKEFAKIFFSGMTWMVLTLGFYLPYYEMRRQTFLIDKARYGNEKFGFDGKGGDLMGSFVLAAILMIPTLFISLIWYSYKKTRYVWNHTTFGKARFQSGITFGGIFGLHLLNALILICTLGFGFPWVHVRTMRYYLENLTLEGQVDLSAIVQDAQEATAFGEEVGDFLDMDFDMG